MKLIPELRIEIHYLISNKHAEIVTDILTELFNLSGEPGITLQDIREQLALLIDEINNQESEKEPEDPICEVYSGGILDS